MNGAQPALFRLGAMALLTLGTSGCAFIIVRPPPLVVGSEETGDLHIVQYPAYVLAHDTGSWWDAHAIKDNLFGLTEGEIVHWVDRGLDTITPGPRHRPVENGVEWIKNEYAELPDCAPVRIVGGLFYALGIEKTTVVKGGEAALSPGAPMSHFGFIRVIYLTDWVQDTVGELNTAGGYLVPWSGPLVPKVVTKPINRGVDSLEDGAIVAYLYVFHKINNGLDYTIDGVESAWGGLVGLFVRN